MAPLPSWVECRPDVGGYARVRFRCSWLTFEHAPSLSDPLFEHVTGLGAHSALIDMDGVQYMSSDALSSLFHLSRRLRECGGQLVLCRLGPHVPLIFTPFPERQREEPNRLAPFLFLDDE
jgi:hypothetical protein